MHNLTSPKTVRALMDKHKVRFSKGLGQNFIIDPHICPEIARQGGADQHTGVLEIGPGVGVLTVELAGLARKVVSVEIDRTLEPLLEETLADLDNVQVVWGDVLKLDLPALLEEHFSGMEVVVCANLPYYITSPIIMGLLEARLPIKSITVMVQKEAAERLCAPLPSRQAGAVTAAVRYYCAPRQLMKVSRGCFLPAPKVDSAVIRLDLHKESPVEVGDEALLFQVVRGAFGQRRKTILNSISAGVGLSKERLSQALEQAGISPMARAEQLSLEEFAAIANALGG